MEDQKVIEVVNKMISLCEPTKYEDFNVIIPTIDKQQLRDAEESCREIGLVGFDTEREGISTLSIIATITDILIQKRLAFVIGDDGYIKSVEWYKG